MRILGREGGLWAVGIWGTKFLVSVFFAFLSVSTRSLLERRQILGQDFFLGGGCLSVYLRRGAKIGSSQWCWWWGAATDWKWRTFFACQKIWENCEIMDLPVHIWGIFSEGGGTFIHWTIANRHIHLHKNTYPQNTYGNSNGQENKTYRNDWANYTCTNFDNIHYSPYIIWFKLWWRRTLIKSSKSKFLFYLLMNLPLPSLHTAPSLVLIHSPPSLQYTRGAFALFQCSKSFHSMLFLISTTWTEPKGIATRW